MTPTADGPGTPAPGLLSTDSGPADPSLSAETGLDPRTAHPARVYAYWLGGSFRQRTLSGGPGPIAPPDLPCCMSEGVRSAPPARLGTRVYQPVAVPLGGYSGLRLFHNANIQLCP